jgi:hypothetical protein
MVKSVTMAELRKSKPPSPKDQHRENVGKGNFNRWNLLSDTSRCLSFSGQSGKRQLDSSSPPPAGPAKAARLDPNLLFEQVKQHEGKLKEAKTILEEAVKAKADADLDNNNILDDGTNSCISKMLLVLTALVAHSEGLTSSIIDIFQEGQAHPPPKNSQTNQPSGGEPAQRGRSGTFSQKKPPTPDELTKKKIRQEINKAEKTTTVFDLNLGQVPIINKDTLSGKVTRAIHSAAASSDEIKKGNYTAAEAEEILDDVLLCVSLDFLGNGGSKKFYNKAKPNDPRNGSFCTVPTKLTFRTKDERIKAEQTLRKFGKVKCSVPYPKKLRAIIGDIVKKGKQVKPNNYIRVKVDTENLTVTAHASVQSPSGRWVWEDLELTTEIPLDVLDKGEQVTLDNDTETESNMETETGAEQHAL